MNHATIKIFACTAALTALTTSEASAQVLWNALDTKPKANMIIAYDTSTTMQIAPNCSDGCHATWGGWSWPVIPWSNTRLYGATTELTNTLNLFKDQFVYGGFRYDTCGGTFRGHDSSNSGGGWADVQYAVMPNSANAAASYNNVLQMITDIQNASDSGASGPTAFKMCEHSETRLPSGGGQPYCFTPSAGCSGDSAWGALVVSNPNVMVPGLRNIPTIPAPGNDLACDLTGGTLNASAVLAGTFSGWTVPHYTAKPSTAQVQADICDPLDSFFSQLRTAMASCQSDQSVIDAYFNMSFYTANAQNYWCDAGYMHDKLCNTWSGGIGSAAMDGSCICQPSQGLCLGPGASPCGQPWSFKARQQVAICESYDPMGLGATFGSQVDNKVNGECRQNVALFFTDGGYGSTTGVFAEGAAAIASTYASNDTPPLSNAYVFRANNAGDSRFNPDAMAQALGNPASYDATNQTALDTSFAMVVNRVQKGVYKSANLAFDPYGTRVAITSFTVPGHPNPANASIPDETYIGRPSRISWHSVNAAGVVSSTPICETDWASRAGYPGMAATPFLSTLSLSTAIRNHIGPPAAGTQWSSGANMYAWLLKGQADRDGNGIGGEPTDMTVDNLAYGYMLNAGPTTPVIVEAPHDAPAGANLALFAQYQTSAGSYLYHRPRMIYTMAGGYLLGFHGGTYAASTAARTAGAVKINYDYNDSTANACREVFRYLPAWVPSIAEYGAATRTPQQLTAGQIAVREVQLASAGNLHDFGTLLVMTQGAGGPNMAALEVTDPMHPAIIGEWHLPGGTDTTTAEPMIYEFPRGASTQPVVVMPGGEGGSRSLYAFSVARTGVTALSSITLPADTYASSAVCFDGSGRGSVTDCVVLGVNGTLVRVPVDRNGRFTLGYVNLTPAYSGIRLAGEKFYTRPAVYFGNNNEVNYVFGSGDIKNLAVPPSVTNQVYRVKDPYNRGGGAATTANVCVADAMGSTTGVVHIGAGEIMVSPPIVSRGVVAFTTYAPGANGCVAGNSYVYAMNYETCKDAIVPASPRPTANAIGSGIPMSPSYIRATDTIITQTSKGVITSISANGRGSGANKIRSGVVPLYWRTELKSL